MLSRPSGAVTADRYYSSPLRVILLPLPEQHEIGLKILIETRHTRTTPPDHRVTHQDHSRRAAV